MSEALEAVVKLVAIGLALGALYWLPRLSPRTGKRVLAALVGLGALGYVNFGRFHTDGSVLHVWDQFHYAVGSKYFPELGYDDLYAALLGARAESYPDLPPPERVRDLRDYRLVNSPELAPAVKEARARFTNERWQSFVRDTQRVAGRDALYLDHGYLPTPAHVFVERLFSAPFEFRTRTMYLFALLDFALLALAGFVVKRAFGLEALAAVALVFGFGYCSRYYWIGGAFLRQDWLVATLLAAAALHRKRPAWAGVALGYAACMRVFPVLLLLPLAAFALGPGKRELRQVLRFSSGLAASSATLLLVGCASGRGPSAWFECARRLALHARDTLPNAIGLRVPLSASLANLRGDFVNPSTLYDYARVAQDYREQSAARWPLLLLASALLVFFCLRLAWRTADPVIALANGVGVLFACVTPTGYYASFFVLLALVQPLRSAKPLLVVNALAFLCAGAVFALARFGLIRLNGAAVYAPVSLLLLLALFEWLWRVSRAERAAVLPR
jgi:hypothetical protein